MKRTFLIFVFSGFSLFMLAQTFVNTQAENRNIVIEEFTGIDCTSCPQGHKLATQFHDQNPPGDVFIVNINSGPYAVPDAVGDIDLRSTWGTALANQSNLIGYPAVIVNRHVFPGFEMNPGGTAMYANNASFNAAEHILTQTAYVNVAAEAIINLGTRELTVVVEVYYTGNSPLATNKINVALLQNDIEGPQSGGIGNQDQVLPNGNYNHQHVLRHLLTGQWGMVISNTSAGSFYTNTITYTIPAMLDFNPNDTYDGIIYDLFNLDILVFVTEGQQEIISANMANITHIVPPGLNLIDLGTTTNMTMPKSDCNNNVTPEATVANYSNIAIDTFEVSYTLNSEAPISQPIYSSLTAGDSTTITFPGIIVPEGTNKISYGASTISGTSYIDTFSYNNSASTDGFYVLSSTAFASSHSEGFDTYPVNTMAPNNAILIEQNENFAGVITPFYTSGEPVGGFGYTQNSYHWKFSNFLLGQEVMLIFDKLDFSNSSNNEITFSFAHANSITTGNDKLQVLVSLDCGITWDTIDEISGSALHTANNIVITGSFYPTPTEWESKTIDLSAYDGESGLNIAFNAIKHSGKDVYIDDIEINGVEINTSGTATNPIKQLDMTLALYPNPTTGILTIEGAEGTVEETEEALALP